MPPLISTHPVIIDFPGLRSERVKLRYFSQSPFKNSKLSCEILRVEIQSVLLDRMSLTRRKSHQKSHFDQFQSKRPGRQETYFGRCLSSDFTQFKMSTEAFVGEVQSVVLERWVGITWRTTCMWNLWNSQPNKFRAESNKTYGFICQNYFKETCLDEEMQPVSLEKISSNTRKHHTYTDFLVN